MSARRRLSVDPTACTGHGLCADLLPEQIYLDEWGYPVIAPDVPGRLARHARRAVRACPALALRLDRGAGRGAGRVPDRADPGRRGRDGGPELAWRADRKGGI